MNYNKKKPRTRDYIVPIALVFVCLLVYPSRNPDAQMKNQLSLNDAKKYVHQYRSSLSMPFIEDEYFTREAFDKILSQPHCVGIRYYPGKTDHDSAAIIAVGVDEDGKDIENGVICIGMLDSLESSTKTHLLEY